MIKILFNNKGEIEKEKSNFDFKEGVFKISERSKNTFQLNNFTQMLLTKDEYIVFINNNEISIMKI